MTTGKENPKRAGKRAETANPLNAAEREHQLLLGRPCKPRTREGVVKALSSMEPEKRALVYDWAMFPINNLLEMAYDHVTNYTDQDRKRENVHAQRTATDYLDGMISWLELVRTSEKVPMLEYEEPKDKVGEQMDWFVWTLEDGGASDKLFGEQIECVQDSLGTYKDYVAGRVRMKPLPDSVLDHLPQETRDDKAQREAKRLAEVAVEFLQMLEPHRQPLIEALQHFGIDPVALEPVRTAD